MSYKDRVEQRKIEQRKLNIEQVRAEINESWVEEKISNYVKRFELETISKTTLKEQILINDIVASFFAKDPSKQNVSEKLAEEELHVPKLPASGRNCIRFNTDGEKVSANGPSTTKSADFIIQKDGVSYYATQKYTSEAGGAQDNQFADVVYFLEKGSMKHYVAAIVDGDFWDSGKRQSLQEHFANNNNVKIFSMEELVNA